jgi:hypothetical protein
MNAIIFILICYGATNNLIYGSIFEGYRNFLKRFGSGGYSLYKLFTCFMCLSTWIGFVVSGTLIYFNTKTPITTDNIYLTIFLCGLLSSGGVWLIHTLQEALERAFTENN